MAEREVGMQDMVVKVMGGTILLGIGVVGSLLWQGNSAIVKLQTSNEMVVGQITALSNQLVSATAGRYTADQATSDRANFMSLLQTINSRNERQDDDLKQLLIWKARIEDRLQAAK